MATSKSLLLLAVKAAVRAIVTVAYADVNEKKENRFRSTFMQIRCGHCFFSSLMLWPFSALNYGPLPLPTTVTADEDEITSAVTEMGCSYLRAYSL